MLPTDTPEKRQDLVLTPVTEDGKTVTVVHDPRSGRYFRIREVEGHIVSLLDGSTSLEAVQQAVLREFPGVRLSVATVHQFAEKLAQLGWLVGSEPGKRKRAPFFRRLVRLQLPPIPADGLFKSVQPLVRLLYQPFSLALLFLAVLAVGYWAFFSMDELAQYPPRLNTFGGWVVLWLGFTLISACHEMGHGVTCRYFGARSNGVGFLLQFGIPCFYCDVSGAWTLSSRRQRLLIGWAGLGWQMIAGAAAFVLWKALEPATLAARLCHVMVGMCGVTALLNLHPFIKLDGYYLLSDWWRIPNLREKSLSYFRRRCAALFLGAEGPKLGDARERRIFFWFGMLSLVYSTLLTCWVVWKLSDRVVGAYGGAGALFLGVFAMAVLWSWLKSAFAGARKALTAPREKPIWPKWNLLVTLGLLMGAMYWFWNAKWTFFIASPCTLEAKDRVAVRPQIEGVLQDVRYREGDRIEAGATLAVVESYDLQKTREQLRQRLTAAAAAADVVKQEVPLVAAEKERDVLHAQQEVRQAQTELDDRESLFPARRAEAERRVQEARAALDGAEIIAERLRADERAVQEGRLTPKMQAVADRIEKVRSRRALAQKDLQRAAFLVNEGALQRQKLDVANTELQTLEKDESALRSELDALRKDLKTDREDAEANVRRLRASYDASLDAQRVVEQETRDERLASARQEVAARQEVLKGTEELRQATNVKRAEVAAKTMEAKPIVTEIERVTKKIHESKVSAPVSGVISTPRLEEKVGSKMEKGETIAWIDRIDTLKARIFVDDKEIGEVHKGMPVQIRVGAYPDRMFEATVTQVSPRPGGESGRPGDYEVRLLIQNPRGELRPGITGYAKILCGRRPLREVAFRKLHRYLRTEVWTWF